MSKSLVNDQLNVLKVNVERLLLEYTSLKQKYEYLAVEYQELREKLSVQDNQSRNKTNVEPAVVSSSEMVLVKAKIDEYIREIDDCLALLALQE
jgi:hypothetical protein